MAVFGTGFFNNQAGCIGGAANIVDFRMSGIYHATPAQHIVRRVQWNRFDNFTGNSLSHLITPTINILADSQGEIKENPACWSGRRNWRFLRAIIYAMARFYRATDKFIVDYCPVYGIEYFA